MFCYDKLKYFASNPSRRLLTKLSACDIELIKRCLAADMNHRGSNIYQQRRDWTAVGDSRAVAAVLICFHPGARFTLETVYGPY